MNESQGLETVDRSVNREVFDDQKERKTTEEEGINPRRDKITDSIA